MAKKKKDHSKESQTPYKEFYDYYLASIPLLKSLIWPIVIVALIISFSTPLQETINQLPNLVYHSSQISMGGFKLEVDHRLISGAPPNLAPILPNLSRDAIILLLNYGTDHPIWRAREPSESYSEFIQHYPGVENLRDSKLVVIEWRLSEWGSSSQQMWMWSLTDLGIKTHSYIITTLIEVFSQNYAGSQETTP